MQLRIENLTYSYCSPISADHTALSGVSLEIGQNEIVAIVGATGSGKTTLIQHFNGLLKPTKGKVLVDSKELSDHKSDLTWIRRKVGLVFQFPEIQLFEEKVYDDVAFGPRNLGLVGSDVDERVRQSLMLVGLEFDEFKDLSPFYLSGGEKRRVAIAGVLAMDPQILVLDEPTIGLDKKAGQLIEDVIKRYNRQGRTVVFVSHDMDFVARQAQRVVVLHQGRIEFDGPKEKLFRDESILMHAGLAMPQVSRFMLRVKEMGYSVRSDIFTVEDAKEELRRIFKERSSLFDSETL